MTEMTAFLSTCARVEDCGSPAERGRAGFLEEEEGRPELNLKGQFGSPKWPRVLRRRRSVPGQGAGGASEGRAQEPGSCARLGAPACCATGRGVGASCLRVLSLCVPVTSTSQMLCELGLAWVGV